MDEQMSDRVVTLAVARKKRGQNWSWSRRAKNDADAQRYGERAQFWERMASWIETGQGA